MFIKEISSESPICEISPHGDVIQLIESLDNKSTMNKTFKEFTFQFRYDKDKGSDLVAFYEEPHSFAFELFHSNKEKDENTENKGKLSKRQMFKR